MKNVTMAVEIVAADVAAGIEVIAEMQIAESVTAAGVVATAASVESAAKKVSAMTVIASAAKRTIAHSNNAKALQKVKSKTRKRWPAT